MRVLRKCFDLVKVLEGAYDGVDPKFGPKDIGLVATSNNGRYSQYKAHAPAGSILTGPQYARSKPDL